MPRLTQTDLLFECKIDKYSEAEIVTLVEDINYAIDNMVMSTIIAISRTADQMPVPRTSPAHLMGYLEEHLRAGGNAAEFAAEFIIRNLVNLNIHQFFFTGLFMGVGTQSRRDFLERLMSELAATGIPIILNFKISFIRFLSGQYDHVAVERWRIMTVEALYRLNDSAEAGLRSELSEGILNLERVIDAAFHSSTRAGGNFFFFGYNELVQWEKIVELARDLSFKIQFFVSSRLELTIAPATNDSYGTYAFGLDRISDGVRVTMLEAKKITRELLRGFDP